MLRGTVQTVDTNIAAEEPCYLVVDSNGNPRISCREIGPGQSSFGCIATIMYATATEITQPPSPNFSALPLLLVSTSVIIGAVVTVVVYVWKKKH